MDSPSKLNSNPKQIPSVALSSGASMPLLGFGCWKIPNDIIASTIHEAIKQGFRSIDEAADYGNEYECGLGIKQAISEGLVTRDQLFITSKLWNTYHRKEHVKAACLKSIKDLGVEYLDLYLIHFPLSIKFVPFELRYPPGWLYDPSAQDCRSIEDPVPIRETWEAMEELVKEGLVKSIGLSNFNTSLIRDILTYAKIKPSVLQVELHPLNTQEKLLKFCKEKDIVVTGYSPLGAGSYVNIGLSVQEENVLSKDQVAKIAEKYKKSPAQIILRWGVQRGTSLVVKSLKKERMIENKEIFDFALTEEEMNTVSGFNLNRKFNDPGMYSERAFKVFMPIYE